MKIVVLAGGLSTERDVSLASGAGICRTLRERGHEAFLLDVYLGFPYDADKLEEVFALPGAGLEIAEGIKTTEPDLVAIKASREDQSDCFLGPNVIEICRMADIVFMGLHGDVGENGKLQATFDLLGIRYTGPNYLGSALAMDKGIAKKIFKMSGVPTPLGTSIKKAQKDVDLAELGLSLPVVVKPCSGGSSIGVYIVYTEEEYRAGEFLESLGNKKSAIIVTALNEYLASHPELQTQCCKIEVKVAPKYDQDTMERLIRTIVEEKISALQFAGNISVAEAVQKPDALEEDVAKMLDNLDLFG